MQGNVVDGLGNVEVGFAVFIDGQDLLGAVIVVQRKHRKAVAEVRLQSVEDRAFPGATSACDGQNLHASVVFNSSEVSSRRSAMVRSLARRGTLFWPPNLPLFRMASVNRSDGTGVTTAGRNTAP